jgi:aryl-alcohol dehydrogenase-like predicted oxidoreductase
MPRSKPAPEPPPRVADPVDPARRRLLAGAAAGVALALPGARAMAATDPDRIATRPGPGGEPIPVVGLGTWQAFDVGAGEAERAARREVLRTLLEAGGRVVDSSPMYGRAEGVVGDLLRGTPWQARALIATKVWTRGRAEGERQMAESERRLGGRVDLMQVHNLLDVEAHLPTLRRWKEAGRIRWTGVTHHASSAFGELERLLREEALDFVQLPYSVARREAERRLLPLAAERGVSVLVMRPFEEGDLFGRVRGRPVPAWAAEAGCRSWAQLFLKFILAHPAVTCAIPATSKPHHMADNARAGVGPPLGDEHRRRLRAELDL